MENIRLRLQPSICLTAIICGTHLLGVVSVMLSGIDLLLQAALNTLVGTSFTWQLYYHVLRASPGSPLTLFWQANGEWSISTRAGDSYRVERWEILLNIRKMTILRFHHHRKGMVQLVLCRDSLAAENLRKLLVRLRTDRR